MGHIKISYPNFQTKFVSIYLENWESSKIATKQTNYSLTNSLLFSCTVHSILYMIASNPKKQYGSEIDWKEAIGSNYYIVSINKANNSAPLIDTLPWGNSITTWTGRGGGGWRDVSKKSPGVKWQRVVCKMSIFVQSRGVGVKFGPHT